MAGLSFGSDPSGLPGRSVVGSRGPSSARSVAPSLLFPLQHPERAVPVVGRLHGVAALPAFAGVFGVRGAGSSSDGC